MDDLDIKDTALYFKYIGEIAKSWECSEKKLVSLCEKTKQNDIKKLSKFHLGLDYKRLLSRHVLGPNIGKLRTNNFEKEFVRSWIYKNKRSAAMGDNKFLLDNILGRIASDDELVIANTLIQWLGTDGGVSFLNSVGFVKEDE